MQIFWQMASISRLKRKINEKDSLSFVYFLFICLFIYSFATHIFTKNNIPEEQVHSPLLHRVSQKHLTAFEITFYVKVQNVINIDRHIPCLWEFMLITSVWKWHFVSDQHAVQYKWCQNRLQHFLRAPFNTVLNSQFEVNTDRTCFLHLAFDVLVLHDQASGRPRLRSRNDKRVRKETMSWETACKYVPCEQFLQTSLCR